MASQWLRRAVLLAACSGGMLLAACGSGSIESQLNPARLIAFGDAFGDLGQNNGAQYTVNDGSVNNWTEQVAFSFGKPLAPAATGGLGYATGNARVLDKPDAAGNGATPTVKEQIDAFLGGNTFGENDLTLISAGTSDVIYQASAHLAGAQSREQMLAGVGQAGRDLGAQVRRLLDAGARYVVVVGPYNLGKSPWALAIKQESLLEEASGRFNEQFLVSVVNFGDRVLYVDAALQFNLITAAPGAYTLTNAKDPICTSVDSGPGIGTGNGQVNSALCTPLTLVPGLDPIVYLFADRVYPTPRGHRLFGEYAYSRIRERW